MPRTKAPCTPCTVYRLLPAALLLLAAALTATGCAASAALRAGRQAERLEDFDRAVVEYTKALRARPGDRDARLALERAKLRAAQEHFARGRALSADGRFEEAAAEYQLAFEMNPTSAQVEEALRETRAQLRAKIAVQRAGKTELETLIEQTRVLPPPGLELPPTKLQASIIFRDASSRAVYTAIARMADISVVFDPAFRETELTIDLRDATLEDALTAISTATRSFYRVTAPRTVTVIPDTPAKRREYEEEVVRTFYLSNADLKETLDLLRIVIDNRRLASVSGTNAIAIKDTPERILAAGRIIGAIDKARPEVVIDVELLEVDRTRLQEYGLQIASPGSPGISGSAEVNREGMTLRTLRTLTQSDVFVANVPGLFYRLLKTDASTRTLANPRLRTSEGMPAQAKFGERVPIPVTTFAPIATGGVAQQPITSFVYENIGVNIDITPRTHHNDDVSLGLKVEISSISGTGFGGLPTFGNRSISTTIRLRDGETNMLAGLIRDDERKVLAGVPGLSDLPVVGRLFAHNRKETQETDIILTLTPHIVRVLDLTETDLRPFRVGRDPGTGVTMVDLPPPIQLPPAEPPPEAPAQPPGTPQPPPGTPSPIRPPVPQPKPPL